MNIKKFAAEINNQPESEVNTLPILSLLMILIPFLLLTTVFVDTSVFELHLPVKAKRVLKEKGSPLRGPALFIYIDQQGLRVGAGSSISHYFKVDALPEQLRKLKERFKKRGNITLISSPRIKYQRIIDIITLSNENGFTNISVADEDFFSKGKPVINPDF